MTPQFQVVRDESDPAFIHAWTTHVSARELSLDPDYLRLLAEASPGVTHHYVACRDEDGAVRGLAYIALQQQRIAGLLPLRVLVLGGRVAAGQAFWFDEQVWSFSSFMSALRQFLALTFPHGLIVLKEFSRERDASAIDQNQRAGFVNVPCFHRSRVPLQGAMTLAAYLDTLSSKRRYHLRKVLRDAQAQGLECEVLERFEHLLDQLYPLYLAVNARAQEARTPPLPRQLFDLMARHLESVRMLVLRQAGQIRGFGLLLHRHGQVKCMVIGQDYAVARELNLWYLLVLHSIEYAAQHGCETVDLGSTNQDMKRKFGAVCEEIWISVRHQNDRWQHWLAPYIRFSLRRMYAQPRREGETPVH
ncbi:GNAT family N-acetyltransferase [Roseateles sp. SL47]|uniref:GNAT family N-acetyltransferase n=1 Tax=Roseateles sp. SL47 TaxID=2995138 RepID=UPI00226F7E7D|nr:GNAT family N-acetyltransferase [Roseateles sp. SL47]WAC71682.1 GNAT family N-acetyltransferase [Roseateles sp. SL47]